MKKLFIILLSSLINITVFAQAPQKMSYQAIIRNSSNVLITNTAIGMRVSILQGSTSGTVVFQEFFNPNPQTNSNGLVTVEIGTGTPVVGTFAAINWATGPYFVQTETDPTGGTSYSIIGVQQLLSVPYALYAANSGNTFIPLAPSVATQPASNVLTNSATLNGNINPNGYSSTVSYEYGFTTSYGSSAAATPSTIYGNTNTSASSNIVGLLANSTYHYRVKATNAVNVAYGADMTFTTGGAPTICCLGIDTVNASTISFRGFVNANNSSTTVTFEYGTTMSYGTNASATPSPISGTTFTQVNSANITGLIGGTTYYFRIKAVNASGTTYSPGQSYTR